MASPHKLGSASHSEHRARSCPWHEPVFPNGHLQSRPPLSCPVWPCQAGDRRVWLAGQLWAHWEVSLPCLLLGPPPLPRPSLVLPSLKLHTQAVFGRATSGMLQVSGSQPHSEPCCPLYNNPDPRGKHSPCDQTTRWPVSFHHNSGNRKNSSSALGCSSVTKCLPVACKALGPAPALLVTKLALGGTAQLVPKTGHKKHSGGLSSRASSGF